MKIKGRVLKSAKPHKGSGSPYLVVEFPEYRVLSNGRILPLGMKLLFEREMVCVFENVFAEDGKKIIGQRIKTISGCFKEESMQGFIAVGDPRTDDESEF